MPDTKSLLFDTKDYSKAPGYSNLSTDTDLKSVSPDSITPSLKDTVAKANTQVKAQAVEKGFTNPLGMWVEKATYNFGMQFFNMLGTLVDPLHSVGIPGAHADVIDVLETIDEVTGLFDAAAGTPSILESLGYTRPDSGIKSLGKKIATFWNGKDIDKINEENAAKEAQFQQERKDKPIPLSETKLSFLTGLTRNIEALQNNLEAYQSSTGRNSIAVPFDKTAEGFRKLLQDAPPIDFGNKTANWLGEGTASIAANLANMVVMGGVINKVGTMGKLGQLAARTEATAKISKVLMTTALDISQTGGESRQIARDTYLQSQDETIRKIGGDQYAKDEDKFIEEKMKAMKKESPDATLSNNDAYVLASQGRREFQDKWLSEQNPETQRSITQHAQDASNTALALNTANLLFGYIESTFFIHGNIKGASILKKPTKWEAVKALKSGASEWAEENINTGAQEAGVMRGKGESYGMNNFTRYLGSSQGANDGFWGFAGGWLMGMIGTRGNFRARKADYDSQQRVMAFQNQIGDSDQNTISQFATLDNSWKGVLASVDKINKLKKDGDEAGAAMESSKMLRYQVEQALTTGTTENLIKNYQKIAESDKFTKEAQSLATTAITKIKNLEKIYNESQKHLNATEVYYNRTNNQSLKENLQEWNLLYGTLGGVVATDNLSEVWDKTKEEIQKLHTEGKVDKNFFNYLLQTEVGKIKFNDTAFAGIGDANITKSAEKLNVLQGIRALENTIIKNERDYANLTSKTTRASLYQMNRFFDGMAETEQKLKDKDIKFKRDGSAEYILQFEKELEKTKSKLTEEHYRAIKSNHEENVKTFNENRKKAEDKAVKDAQKEAKKKADAQVAPVVAEEVNNLHPDTEASTLITDLKNDIGQTGLNIADIGKIAEKPKANEEINAAKFTVKEEDPFDKRWSADPKYIPDNLSEESRLNFANKITGIYNILKRTNPNATFKDLMNFIIEETDIPTAETAFNGFLRSYQLAKLLGYETINGQVIYNELFSNTKELINSLVNDIERIQEEKSEEELIKDDQKTEENSELTVAKENGGEVSFDKNGDEIVKTVDKQTNSAESTLSYYNLEVQEKNELVDGVWQQKYEILNKELVNNPFTPGSLKLSFPDMFHTGTELTASVHPDFMEIPVIMYDTMGKPGQTIKFSQWLAAINTERALKTKANPNGLPPLTPNDQEYINKVPMIYKDADGDFVAFVPDVSRASVFHNTPDSVEDYKANTINIRNNVTENGTANLVTLHKNLGHLKTLELPYDQPKLLKDADPTSPIAVKGAGGTINWAGDVKPEGLIDKYMYQQIENISKIIEGNPFELRRSGVIGIKDKKTGKVNYIPQWFALGTMRSNNLNESSQNTLWWAINAYLNHPEKKPNHPQSQLFKNIIDRIIEITGNNINLNGEKNIGALDKLIKIFAYNNNYTALGTNVQEQITNVVSQIQLANKTEQGKPFMFTQKGVIIIGFTNPVIKTNEQVKQDTIDEFTGTIGTLITKVTSNTIKDYGTPKETGNLIFNEIQESLKSIETTEGTEKLVSEIKNKIQEIIDNTSDNLDNSLLISEIKNGIKEVTDKFGDIDIGERISDTELDNLILQKVNENVAINRGLNTVITSDSSAFMDALKEHLPLLKQNTSINALGLSGKIPVISSEGVVSEGYENYTEYLRGTLRTNHDARKITITTGGVEKSTYISFIHPAITVGLTGTKIVEKVIGISKEEAKQEQSDDKLYEYDGRMLTAEQLDEEIKKNNELLNDSGIKTDDNSKDVKPLVEQARQEIIKSSQLIDGIERIQQTDITNYILNNIGLIYNSSIGEKMTINDIKKIIKKTFDEDFGSRKDQLIRKNADMQKAYNSDPQRFAAYPSTIEGNDKLIKLHETVQKNWIKFEEDAIIMAKKRLKLKGSTQTNLEDANENDGEEEIVDIDGERISDYTKLSEQINPLDSMTAKVRALCYGVEQRHPNVPTGEVDENGEPVTVKGQVIRGVFGIPKYVGLDPIYNNTVAWLADTDANFDTMKAILKTYSKTNTWIDDLIKKLEDVKDEKGNVIESHESERNNFVSVMNNHAMNMEFIMMIKDKTGRYSLRIYSTNSGAITKSLVADWKTNVRAGGRSLVIGDYEGGYAFNITYFDKVLKEYEELKGENETSILPESYLDMVAKSVGTWLATVNEKDTSGAVMTREGFFSRSPRTVELTGSNKSKMLQTLSGKKGKFSEAKTLYTISHKSGNEFTIEKYTNPKPPIEKLISWLDYFGIVISKETAREIITKGFRYDSSTPLIPYSGQWEGEENGKGKSLLGVLAGTLRNIRTNIENHPESIQYDEEGSDGSKLLNQSIINSLAAMEARYTNHKVVQSLYDNHKQIYALVAPKYITDRVRLLKKDPDSNILLKQLLGDKDNPGVSFNQNSFWLELIRHDSNLRDKFELIHLGLTAIREIGKTLYRDNGLQELPINDHETVKHGFFMNMRQGDIKSFDTKYRGIEFRIARMFSPTMSDKTTMTLIKTAVINITKTMLNNSTGYENLMNFAYSQLIAPELQRIKNSKDTNDKAYNEGSKMFFLLPSLNNVRVTLAGEQVPLQTIIANNKTVENFENTLVGYNGEEISIQRVLKQELDAYIKDQQAKKLAEWKESKIITYTDGNITSFRVLDKEYMKSRATLIEDQVTTAALDYTLNSMIANANSFMAIAGDPATFFKQDIETERAEKHTGIRNFDQTVEDTFDNVVKRLAMQIAPRNKLADSDNIESKYLQLMMNDCIRVSDQIGYLTKAHDGKTITQDEINNILAMEEEEQENYLKKNYPKSSAFFNIKSTDAQEVTTWREHLYVLEKLGKLPNAVIDITQAEIDDARNIFNSTKTWEELNSAQHQLVLKMLQPMKPLYSGQIYEPHNDMMRNVYIKSSAFPLIPQLTADFEIDKLAKAMEKMEEETGMTVRASYKSANKLGALKNSLNVFDNEGNFIPLKEGDKLINHTLELPRSNFGIQQNVPLKSLEQDEDLINRGTQITAMMFSNIVMRLKDFQLNGQTLDGIQMQNLYTKKFIDMVANVRKDLYQEIGMDLVSGESIHKDKRKTTKKLADILKNEALLRGYPKQDIEALGIDPKTGTFNLPIWLSPNSNRYEALLSAIITHRIVKIKFPGYSFVTGSQAGFKMQEGLPDFEKKKSQMVFTEAFDGKELHSNQVFIQSKFRVDSKLINIMDYAKWNEEKKLWMLDTDKIDPILLKNLTSFRIPSSKHSSIESVEIAGFLPQGSADLIIVSQDGTITMGEDYDVDKRYIYHPWTTVENGKIIPLHKSTEYNQEGKNTQEIIDNKIAETSVELHDYQKALNATNNKISKLSKRVIELSDELPFIYGLEYGRTVKEYDSLVTRLEKLDDNQLEAEINAKYDLLKKLKKDRTKIYQNEILDIQAATLNHPEVKKLTTEKLSMDDARSDAKYLKNSTETIDTYFTPMSDMYQRDRFSDGIVGKNGTAAYSLDVVSHAKFEQSFNNGKPVQLMETVEVQDFNGEPRFETRPFIIQFGELKSDGFLGHTETLDGKRTTGDVISERQNLMVDNPNEQLASELGLNSYTMNVDKIITMNAFDKGDQTDDGEKHSISTMFISQPIIIQYIKMMDNQNSNTAEYDVDKKAKIQATLLEEYGVKDPLQVPNYDAKMDNKTMIAQIRDGGSDKMFQAAVLIKFLKLEEYGVDLTSLQTNLNIDSKGIGKSTLESMEKLESIKKLIPTSEIPKGLKISQSSKKIRGAGQLIGDYKVVIYNTVEDKQIIKDLVNNEGYIIVSAELNEANEKQYMLIKPTTIAGTFAVNGLVTASQLWSKYFPYNEPAVQKVFKEVISVLGNNKMKETKIIEMKQMIFNNMKKFLYTDRIMNMYTKTAHEERERLFFDKTKIVNIKGVKTIVITEKSLSSYMDDLSKNPSEEVKNMLKTNGLISRFTYDIHTNGRPSAIKFNNSAAENFDEQFMYNSMIELLESNITLPDFNGKSYTSSDLVQDLIAYELLGDPIQEAIQFIKYIPVSYLKAFGINKIVLDDNGKNFADINRNTLGTQMSTGLSTFSLQNIQHYAGQVTKLTEEQMKNTDDYTVVSQANINDLNTLLSFQYTGNKVTESFLSIYNEKIRKGESKFQLYAYDKSTDSYVRIPVLGITGMSEYMAGGNNYRSLVNRPNATYSRFTSGEAIETQEASTPETIDRYNVSSNDLKIVLRNIAHRDTPMGKLAVKLMEFISPDTKFVVRKLAADNGIFERNENTIVIDSDAVTGSMTDEELARVILKETVHSISDRELLKYVKTLGINETTGVREFVVLDGAPKHIQRLVSLFAEVQKALNKNGELRAVTEKLANDKPINSGKEYQVMYGGVNILEFVERMMTQPEFQAEMNKIKFKDSDKSITEKFHEWISEVLAEVQKTLGITLQGENITAQSIASIFEMFQAKKQAENEDAKAEKAINNAEALLGEKGPETDDLGSLGTSASRPLDINGGLFDDEGFLREENMFPDMPSVDPKILKNKDGQPIVVHRGYATNSTFKAKTLEETIGKSAIPYATKGIYFTDNIDSANKYANGRTDKSLEYTKENPQGKINRHYTGDNAHVSSYYIKANNPLIINSEREMMIWSGKEFPTEYDVIILNFNTLGGNGREFIVKDSNSIINIEEQNSFDPKTVTFTDAAKETMLKSGSLIIKC